MAFQYKFPLPSLPIADGKIVFRAWLLDLRAPVFAGTAVALVESGAKVYRVLANGEGFHWQKFVRPGDVIKTGEGLGYMAADGENIPYGKPYSLAESEIL